MSTSGTGRDVEASPSPGPLACEKVYEMVLLTAWHGRAEACKGGQP